MQSWNTGVCGSGGQSILLWSLIFILTAFSCIPVFRFCTVCRRSVVYLERCLLCQKNGDNLRKGRWCFNIHLLFFRGCDSWFPVFRASWGMCLPVVTLNFLCFFPCSATFCPVYPFPRDVKIDLYSVFIEDIIAHRFIVDVPHGWCWYCS